MDTLRIEKELVKFIIDEKFVACAKIFINNIALVDLVYKHELPYAKKYK